MVSFKNITRVPSNKELIDIVFNKTQRKTATVIHPTQHISKIRSFYIKKIRFSSKEFEYRLTGIVEQFPRIEDVHPFYGDLLNVLYDKDHYKMALGHVFKTKSFIDKTAKEYVNLLKYSETAYRAKQLKVACLGKMATIAKKLGKSMEYLEEVRQHISRLPSIDPTALSLILCGFPNVGKSSFINKISRAEVDVQPYAFTTKNLFVGHFDFDYLRWQIIDTPGILDHPIEERNTIEMQTITALAHIQSCVVFFFDITTDCGYTILEQVNLFKNVEPLFSNYVVAIPKSDLLPQDIILDSKLNLTDNDIRKILVSINTISLDEEDICLIVEFLRNKEYITMSSTTENNLDEAKNRACRLLLDKRVELKKVSSQMKNVANQLNIIQPKVKHSKAESKLRVKEGIDGENEDFNSYLISDDYRDYYVCGDKYDIIPEFYNGKNIADFIDTDISLKLDEAFEQNNNSIGLREYNLFTKEERKYKELIQDRKRAKEIENDQKKRAAIPERWVNNRVIDNKDKTIMPAKKISSEPIRKGTFRRSEKDRYYERKFKHIHKATSRKGFKSK